MNEKLIRLMGHRTEYYPTHLEKDFPHILESLMGLWGTPAFDVYAEELLLDNRSGRSGFPPEVAMELFHLANLHKDQMKLTKMEESDVWGNMPENGHRGTMDWDER